MKLLIHILKLYVPMLPFIVGFYGVRLVWWDYMNDLRAPLGLMVFFVIPIPFGILSLIVGIILTIVMIVSLKYTNNSLPSIFLLTGIILTMFLPLPKTPPLPETLHFLEYRADYEIVIDLARTGQLDDSSTNYCKHPPLAYQHVSGGGCISIDHYNDGLKVQFIPIEKFYYSIIYIENDKDITSCGHRFYIAEKLNDHWYLCFENY